jgi:hypothetical protein
MQSARILLSLGVLGSAAMLGLSHNAQAADVTVYTYGPRAPLVAPATRVYVGPAGAVAVAPRCVTRSVRVWVDGRYIYRTVRRCG